MNKAAAMQVYQQAMTGLSFCDVELIEAKEAIDSYLQDEACSDFRYPMSELFRTITSSRRGKRTTVGRDR